MGAPGMITELDKPKSLEEIVRLQGITIAHLSRELGELDHARNIHSDGLIELATRCSEITSVITKMAGAR